MTDTVKLLLVAWYWLIVPLLLFAVACAIDAAITWTRKLLHDTSTLLRGSDAPPPSEVRTHTIPLGVADDGARRFGWDR